MGNGTAKKIATNAAPANSREAHRRRALAKACNRSDHDRQHRRFEPEEQHRDQRYLAIQHIDVPERHDGHGGQEYKQAAGDAAAPGLVHQAAKISGELRCFCPGPRHAVVAGVEKPAFREPALLV